LSLQVVCFLQILRFIFGMHCSTALCVACTTHLIRLVWIKFGEYLSIYLSVCLSVCLPIYPWLYSPFLELGRFFSFVIFFHIVGETPWTGDQPVARPLPTHNTAQTQNKHNTDIHVSNGIRTHDPSVRVGEDCSCLRLCGHCDRHVW
jgi:hypothetical protein